MNRSVTPAVNGLLRAYTPNHESLFGVLPTRFAGDARRAMSGELPMEQRILLIDDLDGLRVRIEKKLDDWLSQIDPNVLFYPERLKEGAKSTKGGNYLIDAAGLNRFAWVIGVGGGGLRQDVEVVSHYFEQCGRWLAVVSVLGAASIVDEDLPAGLRSNRWREQVKRIMATDIRTRWACELICTSFADVVASSGEFSALKHVTKDNVADLFEWLQEAKTAMDDEASRSFLSGRVRVPNCDSTLLPSVSITSGSLFGSGFGSLVFSPSIDNGPIVAFGGEYLPVALRESFTSLDLAFFNMAREAFVAKNGDKLRSDLFEFTVREAIRRVIVAEFDVPSGEILCSDPLEGSNEGETDFLLIDRTGLGYVGECKAMVVPVNTKTVLNAFKNQLETAVGQVTKRRNRIENGHEVTVDGKALTRLKAFPVHGIITPLHSYATAILDRHCLLDIFAVDSDISKIAIVPLHQLVLLMAGIKSGEHLNDYFSYRGGLLERGVQIFDEMDSFISFIYAADNARSVLAQIGTGTLPLLAQYSMEFDVIYESERPSSSLAWVQTLKDSCRSGLLSQATAARLLAKWAPELQPAG